MFPTDSSASICYCSTPLYSFTVDTNATVKMGAVNSSNAVMNSAIQQATKRKAVGSHYSSAS